MNGICKIDSCENPLIIKSRELCSKHYHRWQRYSDPVFIPPKIFKICKIENCNKQAISRGWCLTHYMRWIRHRDPLFERAKKIRRICKVEGCSLKHDAKGYCNKHYKRFKNHGNPLFTENHRHGKTKTSVYRTWCGMKRRCLSTDDKDYKNYGKRGITICDRWENSFIAFYQDMGDKPFPKAQIDRINNDGNYEPSNCRWVTSKENCNNRRPKRKKVS